MSGMDSIYGATLLENGRAVVWDVCSQGFVTLKQPEDYVRLFRTVPQERAVVLTHLVRHSIESIDQQHQAEVVQKRVDALLARCESR